MTANNYFGEYLLSLRLSRRYSSIREYVAQYDLPLVSKYYRDLESGKSKVAMETAKLLCEALQADSNEFYTALLKDVLPASVANSILSEESQSLFSVPMTKLSDEAIALFKSDLRFLDICVFIYSHDDLGLSMERLQKFLSQNDIAIPVHEIVTALRNWGIISVIEEADCITRICRTNVGLNWNDPDLELYFLQKQTDRFFAKDPATTPSAEPSVSYTGIIPYDEFALAELSEAIEQMLGQLEEFSESNDLAEDMEPFVFAAIVQPPISLALPAAATTSGDSN